ncbi:TRAP transporter substrate-binding protein [Budviciaceae bacterium BWR-B9]|uniref:TRAP transporter substrate-binding protein n=1 Tax=Limnobaculum allomyrinae TaxID=2791986 RepID=A0ABS1IRE2_9GAMM|nr:MULTISPECIES: TRAP transporter substrate-binding protein [Limnobaculum]MBK5144323.1 TRAP transporter substrate-binding protein [Limnobaculum allomyrinae]MBV7691932.1 TRAP transporter substrate-binding protein [Limnobaculum sp. M2-1]
MSLKKGLLPLIIGSVMLVAAPAYAAVTMKLSHNHNRNHPVQKAMEHMANRAKELSDGNLVIRIYPDAQLGDQRESLELVQNGALAMAKSNAAELEAFSKNYGAFNMPYLFTDREHYYRAMLSESGKSILQSSRPNGFIGLTYYDAGSRSFYAKKAINSPDDLKGLKVRVQPSPSAVEMIKLLGGNPTPLAYGELYTALQQGVVDAAENNLTALTLNRHGEVTKFYSVDEHTSIPDVLVISAKVWDGLSEKDQKALQQAADESMMFMKDLWAKSDAEEKVKAEKMGVQFIYPKKASFQQAVQPMYDGLQKSNPEVYQLVDSMKKL